MLAENTPKFDAESRIVTLPSVEGIQWLCNGEKVNPGRLGPLQEGQTVKVEAEVVGRVRISGDKEWTFGG
jgi:hypothetical protein